jgi:NTE family protein
MIFCATDFVFRDLWTFDSSRGELGDACAGRAPLGDWTIARAAAVSSCLAGAFEPLRIPVELAEQLCGGTYTEPDRDELVRELDLGDGGFYDDLGVEPVWDDHAFLLVSDAGPAYRPDPHIGWIWRDLRYAITPLEQATRVRKRWLEEQARQGNLSYACWEIADQPAKYPYPAEVVRNLISQVRIDLDRYSPGEQATLENHGYLLADAAVQAKARGLIARNVPAEVPHREWLQEDLVRQALTGSQEYRLIPRR